MTIPQSALGLAALLCVVLAAPAQAAGVGHTTPASTCRPYKTESAAALAVHRVQPGYTANSDPTFARQVICPVMRNGDDDGVRVWIYGRTLGGASISCSVISYWFDGGLRHVVTQSGSPPFAFDFSGLQAHRFGHLNAVCRLPPAGQGQLFHIYTEE